MNFKTHSERMMGTVITLSIFHKDAENLLKKCFEMLKMYEHRFSANADDSELMAVNFNAGINSVVVHEDLFELISLGKKHSLAPKSHLNIAIGPLVQTWRIGFSDAKLPTEKEINSALEIVNPDLIELNESNRGVYLAKKGMKIDLGALAKGYIADKISDYLREQEVESALINLGGNIVVIGENAEKNEEWSIGIQNPKEPRGEHLAVLSAKNKSIVTSGIYERRLEYNGESYHHIFDSTTGYPIKTELASLTIVSDKSVDGEIWTTRLFGESLASIIMQVESEPGIEAIIVTENNNVYPTTGLLTELKIFNKIQQKERMLEL